MDFFYMLLRWFHFLAGITWIGILYYFNFVQVAAQKTQEEAQASYRGIQAKYASVLSGRQPVIRRKDLGSKGVFYGAQVGPFSREDAVQLCESLKTAGATCMVQKN